MNTIKGMSVALLIAALGATASAQEPGLHITRKVAGTVITNTMRPAQEVCGSADTSTQVAGGAVTGALAAGAAKGLGFSQTTSVLSGIAGAGVGSYLAGLASKDCKTLAAGYDVGVEFPDKSEVLVKTLGPRVVGASAVVLFYSNGTFGLR